MATLTPGKIRGLDELSDAEGRFGILAADHRDSLRVELDPDDPEGVPAEHLTAFKLELVSRLADRATGVMLDPEYSAGQALVRGALPGSSGFLCALEAQGYLGDPHDRRSVLLEGWSVEKAARLGASGIKLLLFYNPDGSEAARHQEDLVRAVVEDCARHDLPFFLEPLPYDITPDERPVAVIETARRLGPLGPEVLKQPFPVAGDDRAQWHDACAELNEAAGVPWALLSGGDPFERFSEQLAVACEAGCSGFMVGRAVWREALTASGGERTEILETVVGPRLDELRAISAGARSWAERHDVVAVDDTWYERY